MFKVMWQQDGQGEETLRFTNVRHARAFWLAFTRTKAHVLRWARVFELGGSSGFDCSWTPGADGFVDWTHAHREEVSALAAMLTAEGPLRRSSISVEHEHVVLRHDNQEHSLVLAYVTDAAVRLHWRCLVGMPSYTILRQNGVPIAEHVPATLVRLEHVFQCTDDLVVINDYTALPACLPACKAQNGSKCPVCGPEDWPTLTDAQIARVWQIREARTVYSTMIDKREALAKEAPEVNA